jgi:hypothetical protein
METTLGVQATKISEGPSGLNPYPVIAPWRTLCATMGARMQQIKSFGVMQTAKALAAVYFVIGVIAGVLTALVAIFRLRPGRAVAALLLTPVVYTVAGFILIVLFSTIYNAVAKKFGGIEIELS